MNISYDDTSPYLQFSQEWRVQPDNDASSASFWQNTYHAVQTKGATLRITFNGAGIYVYGSKGPHNAEYTVELDDKVFFYNDKPPSVRYQQLLFGQSVRQGGHTIVLTHDGNSTTAGSDNSWLDVDYIMITQPLPNGVDTQSDPGSIETTGGPAGASNSAPTSTDPNSTGSPVPLPGVTGGANGSTNDNNSLTIVVILLAALLGLVLVGAMGYFIWRRIVKNRKAEQAFRHGTNQAPTTTMQSHTTGVTLPPAGPFDTPPGSAMVHPAPFNVTDSPVASVLQIGRSVAMLESDGSGEVVPIVRTHSSLSQHTGFSQTSYAITPEGAFAAHPPSRHNSYDALREVVSAQPQATMDSSYAVPPPPPPPPPAGTPSSWNSDRPSRGPPGQRQPRTWNPAAGAPSIKTFVQVMDE